MLHYIIGRIKNFIISKKAGSKSEIYICEILKQINISTLLKIYRGLCQYKTITYNEKNISNYAGWEKIVREEIGERKEAVFYDNLIHFFKLRARNINYTYDMPVSVITFIAGLIIPLYFDEIYKIKIFIESYWLCIIIGFFLVFSVYIFLSTHLHREYEMYEDLIDILEEMKKETLNFDIENNSD